MGKSKKNDNNDCQHTTPAATDASAAYHVPVLLHESVGSLITSPNGVYVDVTFGGGGHSREILSRLGPDGHLFGFDQDEDAAANCVSEAGKSLLDEKRFTFIRSNFRWLKNWMRYYEVEQIDGLLADLGVSSHHLDEGERGFSFRFDAPLDMRMNRHARLTAADVVNDYSEEQLADVFYHYGELRYARRLAAAVVKARGAQRIATTQQLANIAEPLAGHGRTKKDMARVFQALRIEVNGEMEALKDMLAAAAELIKPGGRLCVITYHSLEDRIVKNMMKAGNAEGKVSQDFFGRVESPFRIIGNKTTVPDNDELETNPRSRSAKLRVAEKLEN